MSRILAFLLLLVLGLALPASAADAPERITIALDTSETEAVLAILAKRQSGQEVAEADWQRLFATEPYLRLKKRETGMRRDFSDRDFKRFVLSEDLGKRTTELRRTLEAWKQADLHAAAARALAYLPAQARIRAKIYPVIKPRTNSFVFETTTDPAIFLYLDPEVSQAEFDNTVAHELHHIGYASLGDSYDKNVVAKAPANVRPVLNWIGAFGEGMAVLAAAGSPDVHPMAASKPEDRIRWDQDMKGFGSDLKQVEQFFLDILRGGFKDEDTINHVGFHFFGYRGPWYTVGYRMAALVEQRYGREALLECMLDQRKLLARYNQAAVQANSSGKELLALWSPELLKAVGALEK